MTAYTVLTITKDLGFTKSVIHPVAIRDENGIILFDAGYPDQADDIEQALADIGGTIADITAIVLSHHDHDHIGSLAELKRRNPKIRVLSGAKEADYISGKKTSLRLLQALEYNKTLTGDEKEFGERFARYLETVEHCPVDDVVQDLDYLCDGVRVIGTPGHTPGHISLLLEKEKLLLAGDALAIENGKLAKANPKFTLDKEEALKSVEKIKNLNLERISCYHGNMYSGPVKEELVRILAEERNA